MGEVGSEGTRNLWFAEFARKDLKWYPKRGREGFLREIHERR